tara:strand:+ start:7 stop:498 length:492 start_codon:yes stop_codon:yes gene_type:complete
MIKYGYSFFDTPKTQTIYEIISDYFENPVMTKIKNKDSFSVYMVRIKSLLLNETRYLIAMVNEDYNNIETRVSLSDLKWKYFQTRELYDSYRIPEHSYLPKNKSPYTMDLLMESTDENQTDYLPKNKQFKVSLLHPTNIKHYYPNDGTLTSALEIYKTIITKL